MRAVAVLSVLVGLLAAAPAFADGERLVIDVGLEARLGLSTVSFAEQAGEDSVGNDLGRFGSGVSFGIGLETQPVTLLLEVGAQMGGLSSTAVAEHYFSDASARGTSFAWSAGAAARYERPLSKNLDGRGSVRVGYSRMLISGSEDAHLSSVYMELGGGIAMSRRLGSIDGRLALIASVRAHRPGSFAASGLTEGTLNADNAALFYYPGVSLQYSLRF